jgi:hypothetical protein
MIKTCKLKLKICSHMYPCDGCHDVNTVCVLFLRDARDAYRGLPGLSRLSRVDHWMITRFSQDNLGGSLQHPTPLKKNLVPRFEITR